MKETYGTRQRNFRTNRISPNILFKISEKVCTNRVLSLATKSDRPWRTPCSNRNASIKIHEEERVKSDTVGDAIKMKSILYPSNLLRKIQTKKPRKAGDKKRHRSFLELIYFALFLLHFCFSQNQFVSEKGLNFF